MQILFGKTKLLESQVDQFLDLITKGTLCMREAIRSYLSSDDEDFQSRLKMVGDYERRADELRRSTESMLYTYSLIPESRADVLELLENLDIEQRLQIIAKELEHQLQLLELSRKIQEQVKENIDKSQRE